MASETFLRACPLLSSVARNDPKPEISWLGSGGAAWLGMESNLRLFSLCLKFLSLQYVKLSLALG